MSTHTEWVPEDTFGGRLMLLRHQLGLTTEEIADRCDLKTPTWSTWERGATPRNMSAVVAKVALATGVSRAWLMWGGPLSDPSSRPSDSLGQAGSWHNADELMQYRQGLAVRSMGRAA
jgi:transcriptional regulator with XRE-family HTH domain